MTRNRSNIGQTERKLEFLLVAIMNARTQNIINDPAIANRSDGRLLQRKCSCGSSEGPTNECQNCRQQSALDAMQHAPFARDQVADHESPSLGSPALRESHIGHDFSRVPVNGISQPVLQRKLTVNEPGDIYEKEADCVADQVFNHPQSLLRSLTIQRRANGNSIDSSLNSDAQAVIAEAGSGNPLPEGVRSNFEDRFGREFGHVRIHTDATAARSAESFNAKAYTLGSHVVFGAGEFQPFTRSGSHLLAHELTHTIQRSASSAIRRVCDKPESDFSSAANFCLDTRFSPTTHKGKRCYREIVGAKGLLK